jgi:hypothetical protein
MTRSWQGLEYLVGIPLRQIGVPENLGLKMEDLLSSNCPFNTRQLPNETRYRIKIVGKDTIKETVPAQYRTKTEMVVVQEDISPGTPMSLLTLDSRVMQKNEARPTIYSTNALRKPTQPNNSVTPPDAGFESAESKKVLPNSNPQSKTTKQNESKNKKDKKKPAIGTKKSGG